jgi:4-carboxymuconolactone decarboxylase
LNKDEFAAQTPFPIGQVNDDYAQYFTGQSYLQPLSQQQVNIFNVTFSSRVATIIGISTMQRAAADRF